MKSTLINSNAIVKTKRRSKTADLQTLCMLGLMGLALFAFTACENAGRNTSYVLDALDNINPDDYIQ